MGCVGLTVSAQSVGAATKDAQVGEQKVAALPVFDVSSVKPNNSSTSGFSFRYTPDGVSMHNASLLMIIRGAYRLFDSLDDKFIGIPNWAKDKRFDIEAKVSGADAETFSKLNSAQRSLMIQALLADRFKLHAHDEVLVQPVYVLALAKGGPKLAEPKPAEGSDANDTIERRPGLISAQDAALPDVVSALTQTLGRTVVDETGLKGKYDLVLKWTPDDATGQPAAGSNAVGETPDAAGPSIFTAIQEQLGLKLEPAKRPVECLVIDHVEMPSEN
jgi:uncharacterized protein (TIGR03435 family)